MTNYNNFLKMININNNLKIMEDPDLFRAINFHLSTIHI